MGQLYKNVASQKVRVFAFADAGHATLDPGEPVTGDAANISAYTAADNAALGASNDVAPTEVDATNAPGVYEFDATQGETNGSVIEWYPKSSTAGVQVVTVGGNVQTTKPQYFPDFNIASDGDFAGNVDGTVATVTTLTGHTAQTGDGYAYLGTNLGALGANATEAGGTGDHLTAVPDTSGTTTLLSRLSAVRAGYLDNLSAGAVATASALSSVATNVSTLLTRIPAALFSGITSLANWLRLMARSDAAITTDAATELGEINSNEGSGAGDFAATSESLEAVRDHIGDGTNLTEAGGDGDHLTEAGGTGDHLTAVPWNAAWDAEVQSEVNDALVAFFTSAANLVDLIWDEVITGAAHNVNNSAAKYLREAQEASGVTGTAQAATSTNITLASGAVTANDIFNGERVRIIEGTGAGQSRLITDSVITTDVCTVHRAWTVTPDATSVYVISSADSEVVMVDGELATATAGVDFDDLAAILLDTGTDGVAISAAVIAAIADGLLDRTDGVEPGSAGTERTVREALRIMLSAAAGKSTNGGKTFRDTNDSKDRITATVDGSFNRTAVTLDDT